MSFGYCLLHANRIDTALSGMREDAIAGDEGVDLGLGAIALREPEQLLTGYLEGVARQAQAVLARLQQAFSSPGGVFADLQRWIAELARADFASFRLTPWVDRLADLFVALEPTILAGRLDAVLERIAVALPELNGGGLLDGILDVVLGGLEVLERRRIDGDDSVAGHRAYRMARIVRIWLGEALAEVRTQLAQFDLMATLRRALRALLGGVEAPGAGALRALAELVQTKVRPFAVAIDALLAVRVSVSVNASASAEGLPELLPELGDLWLDDNLAAPHGHEHPLWWLDLSGGLASLAFTIVDVQRFNPFYAPRTGDAILSLLNLGWQTVRTLVRAIRPEFLRRNHTTTGAAFWFSELGDFCVQVFLNFLGSLHEAPDAGSNWVMSFATRLARWYTFTLQPRIPYMFARAVWYTRKWKEQGWTTEHVVAAGETIETIAGARGLDPIRLRVWNRIAAGDQPAVGDKLLIPMETPGEAGGGSRAPFSFARHAWSTWAWLWLVGAINGMCQSWEDMQLNDLGSTDFIKVGLWLGPLVGVLAAIFMPAAISEGAVWPNLTYELDWATFGAFTAMLLIVMGMVAGSMYSTNATKGVWWLALIGVGLMIALLFVPVLVLWLKDPPDIGGASGWLYAWMLISGVVVFGLLTTILWWIYFQDGRDKLGHFTGLDAATSPYKLPWTQNHVWICGQGFHGIFSHYQRDNAFNHFGYDFLEGKDEPAMAARGGLVVTVRQCNPYGSPNQNDLGIQHLDWVAGHDPGTPDERVLTYSHYIHIGPECARVDIDQYVIQGQHLVDIDSTGMSAQHHLHFGASQVHDTRWPVDVPAQPNRGNLVEIRSNPPAPATSRTFQVHGSRPVIFRDASLRRDRTNPILRVIPGHIHHPGRPLAQCLYKSDNAPAEPLPPRPIVLVTQALPASFGGGAAVGAHTHRLELSVAQLLAPGPVYTTVDAGHRHRVQLSAAQVQELLRHALPSAWATESALSDDLAHTHSFEPEAFTGSHLITRATGAPPVTETSRADTPVGQVSVCAPPPAQLVARVPGPYDLLGHRLVIRVDDEGTEWFDFGGQRAQLVADVAVGRCPGPSEAPVVGVSHGPATAPAFAPGPGRVGLRPGVAAFDDGLARTGVQLRLIPVLVLETRARGSAARLELDGSSSGAGAFGIPASGVSASGSGGLPNLHATTRAQLVSAFAQALNGAPAQTAPAAASVHAAATATGTTLDVGGHALSFAGSPRTEAVFAALYQTTSTELSGLGPLPLEPARFTLTWGAAGAALEVPICGVPASAQIDPGPAWLSGASLSQTPLEIQVGASTTALHLATGSSLDAIAAQIEREVDGVRAWTRAGQLWIETVDVGPDLSLMVRKAKPAGAGAGVDFALPAATVGQAPGLAGGASIRDSALLTRDELIRLITDAAQRSEARQTRAAAIAAGTQFAVGVEIQSAGGEHRLRLHVAAPHTITLEAGSSSPALVAALGLTASAQQLVSQPLAEPVELPGGWIDLRVDATVIRVELDAAPARIELPPREPALGAAPQLRVKVDGAAAWTNVDLSGLVSLDAISGAIAAATGQAVRARIAHRVAVEARTPGQLDLSLADLVGRSALGFLSTSATLSSAGAGPGLDLQAVTNLGRGRVRIDGRVEANAYTAALVGAPPRLELTAPGRTVSVHYAGPPLAPGASDPFGFVGPRSAELSPTSIPHQVLRYRVRLNEAGIATVVGGAWVELSASPAMVRAIRPASVLPLGGAARLSVEVTWPEGGATKSVTSVLDLRGATALLRQRASAANREAIAAELRRRVVDQIQREVPKLRAWLVEHGDPARPACIQLETQGAGTGWRLRLVGEVALLALGFDPASVVGGALEVHGRGNIRDAAEVQPSEVRDAFTAAAAFTTISDSQGIYTVNPGTGADQGRLTVASAGARIELRADPPELDQALTRAQVGDAVVIDARQPLDLPGGVLSVVRASQTVARVYVIGSPARIVSPNAVPSGPAEAALVTQLTHLPAGHKLVVRTSREAVDIGWFPNTVTSLDAAVAYMGRKAPTAFVSLQPRIGGGRQLVVEDRVRGSASRIALEFHGLAPTFGCTANLNAAGRGSFPDLGRIDAVALETALEAAYGLAAVDQSLATGHHDAGRVELRAVDTSASLTETTRLVARTGATPMLGPVPNRLHVRAIAWPSPRALHAGVAVYTVRSSATLVGATTSDRRLWVPIWANPARLELRVTASRPWDFHGRNLALSVGPDAITVAIDRPRSWSDVAAQIERGCGWKVRASLETRTHPSRRVLILSTFVDGTDARLVLRRAASHDVRGLVEDPAAASVERRGRGSVPQIDAVDGPALAAALGAGFSSRDNQRPASSVDTPRAWWGRYRAGAAAEGPVVRIQSSRTGCMSAVEPLAGHERFSFDRSLQRAPAQRAAIVIPPGGDVAVPASAKLVFEFDANTGTDASPARRVEVPIAAGSTTRAKLAAQIHAVLFGAGAGTAGAYLDGSIVIETGTPGLAGTVKLLRSESTAALITSLGVSAGGSDPSARGWAGAGQLEESEDYRIGARMVPGPISVQPNLTNSDYLPFRGLRAKPTGAPTQGVGWRFLTAQPTAAGGFATTSLVLQSTWNAERVAREVDDKLRLARAGATTARIGHAKVGDDGAVHIEAVDNRMLVLEVTPAGGAAGPVGVDHPSGLGERDDIKAEPGWDLRVTDTLRTYRLVYDRRGEGDTSTPTNFVDVGWVRPPTDYQWGVPRQRLNYQPLDVPAWPRGRYLLAGRVEAAKHDYGHGGEMIASAGQAAVGGETWHFARVARYWFGLTCLTRWNLNELWHVNGAPRHPNNLGNITGLARAQVHRPLCVGLRQLGTELLLDWLV